VAKAGPAVAVPDEVRRFLDRHAFGVVATINPDGSPHTAVVWYLFEDNVVVINSAEGRRWPSNLRRDPRMSFAVEDGLDWVSLRGTVGIVEDQAQSQADIAAMARKYDTPAVADEEIRRFQGQRRVSFRLRPIAIHAEIGVN
jgi:PPOX class probable F420-dependent enzyme